MLIAPVVIGAVLSSDKLCRYFTSASSGDLKEGTEIRWCWKNYDSELPVMVDKIIANELIQLTLDSKAWKKTPEESYSVKVIFEFEELDDDSTMLSISEEGWKTDADGLKASHDNCSGWSHMATCLKAWIEHDIDLR